MQNGKQTKLLIITQAVDKNDTVLGFFHGWVQAFSQQFDVTVVCLRKGAHTLSVPVVSLGKEECVSRLTYLYRFYKAIFTLDYDAVFVHMNQEYVLLGGIFWRLMGKKVALWYNHTYGTWRTRLACWLAHRVYCTSAHAFTAKRARRMPAGIDTDYFDGQRVHDRSLLFLGRISPVKKVDLFLDAYEELCKRGTYRATICGEIADQAYWDLIRPRLERLPNLTFVPGVPHTKTRELYASHGVYVNLTQTGSFDKTILEALACRTLVVTSNQSFADILTVLPDKPTSAQIADAIEQAFAIDTPDIRNTVIERHSLKALVQKVQEDFSKDCAAS